MNDEFINMIRKYCKEVDYYRSKKMIFNHLFGEVHELDIEIAEESTGKDGVFGESIDVILCAFDLIFKERPNATNQEIIQYAQTKLDKWKTKYQP